MATHCVIVSLVMAETVKLMESPLTIQLASYSHTPLLRSHPVEKLPRQESNPGVFTLSGGVDVVVVDVVVDVGDDVDVGVDVGDDVGDDVDVGVDVGDDVGTKRAAIAQEREREKDRG